MKSLILLSIVCTCSGCMTALEDKNTLDVIQGTGPCCNAYVSEMLAKCKYEAAVITIAKFEANPSMNKEDVQRFNDWLLWKCYTYYKIDI